MSDNQLFVKERIEEFVREQCRKALVSEDAVSVSTQLYRSDGWVRVEIAWQDLEQANSFPGRVLQQQLRRSRLWEDLFDGKLEVDSIRTHLTRMHDVWVFARLKERLDAVQVVLHGTD